MDDLLWVLTDSQLKAMVQYAKSLSEAIEKSTEQRKSMAPEPAQVCCKINRRFTSHVNMTNLIKVH